MCVVVKLRIGTYMLGEWWMNWNSIETSYMSSLETNILVQRSQLLKLKFEKQKNFLSFVCKVAAMFFCSLLIPHLYTMAMYWFFFIILASAITP